MSYTIAIDIGGTCTDCVALDARGELHVAKTLSTPPDFSVGIIKGLELLASTVHEDLDGLLGSTALFLHSTTVGENALVDGTTARAGLITTRGFEDTLFAMRGGYGRWSGLTESEKRDPIRTAKPRELIPRRLIRGLEERIGARGERLVEPDERDLNALVEELLEDNVESVAVSLLWSFLDPGVESKVEASIRALRPDLFVTLSHKIAPSVGEYERTSTTALNALLGPVVTDYLTKLEKGLKEHGFTGSLLVMQAYGGLLPASEARARPIGMIESGPVGGLLGSREVGNEREAPNVISADMGGTTFKVGVVRDRRVEYERDSMVLRYHFAAPKFDIASLGLAGGSIISVEPTTGIPTIGPRSAGSFPGPVCYGNGGEEPTVTDADALLGYLHPDFFLGGSRELHIDAARAAFEEKVADALDMTLETASTRIYRLTNSLIYDMLHRTIVQRGLDPRHFELVSIGGTAGMHVTSYAAMLGIPRVVIPSTASVHSAVGLLHSDIVHEGQVTRPLSLPVKADEIANILEELGDRVRGHLLGEGFRQSEIRLSRSIDMRFARQTHMVTVPVEVSGSFDGPALEKTVDRFEQLYQERYGPESGYRDAGIELVAYRVRGSGHVKKPTRRLTRRADTTDPTDALVERRRAWVDDRSEYMEVDGYSFDRLRPGNVIKGPAIVWSPITTIVLRSTDSAEVDEWSNLVVTPS